MTAEAQSLATSVDPPAGRKRSELLLGAILILSLILKTWNIDRPALTYCDESFHALVARSLLQHPLKPALVDPAYLPYDYRDWQGNHVWLHKGILPLWQIAASYAVFGVNTFALRLPSAILATASVWLTFLIGRRLLTRRAALLAAGLQAINPALTMLVQGYWFSDHVDTALVFWVELGIYFLVRAAESGAWRYVVFAGLAQGAAFLCKYYPALILQCVAVAVWLLPKLRLSPCRKVRLCGGHVAALFGVTLATVAPWLLWCVWQFPRELHYELLFAARHLGESIEGWGAPWDRVLFDYLIQIYREFYTPVLVAVIVLLVRGLRRPRFGLWFVLAWALGVLIPHILATTKTPSATMTGLPAFYLLLGYWVSEAWRGQPLARSTWIAAMAVGVAWPAVIGPSGEGYPDPPTFAGVMRGALWVVWHVLLVLGLGLIGTTFLRRRRALPNPARWEQAWRVIGSVGMLVLAGHMLLATLGVVTGRLSETKPQSFTEIGGYAATQLPANAVLLVDDQIRGEHRLLQFYADRVCYEIQKDDSGDASAPPRWLVEARSIRVAGGVPYLVTPKVLPIIPLHVFAEDQRFLYACPP